jgi:hypothetical protein
VLALLKMIDFKLKDNVLVYEGKSNEKLKKLIVLILELHASIQNGQDSVKSVLKSQVLGELEQQIVYLQTKLVVAEKENEIIRRDVHLLTDLGNLSLEQLNEQIGKSVENLSNLRREFDQRVAKKPIDICLACSKNVPNILFLDCRHLCVCEKCSMNVKVCPRCQSTISKMIETFV